MVRFQCETCGRLKEANEAWILGFAAENIGVISARREIEIATAWDPIEAVAPLAVHFCSDVCRAQYMGVLFGETPETQSGEATVTKRRIQRVLPEGVVDTVVTEKKPATVVRRTVRRKRAS
ncbi:MAG TPA: hypothetical protein VJA94_11515 [Candidatus Angelobacter sp.]